MQRAARLVAHVKPRPALRKRCCSGSGDSKNQQVADGLPLSSVPVLGPDVAASAAVLYELHGHVAKLTLNRAANRNAMTFELLEAVRAAAARAGSDPEVRCILLTGLGRNFCGGADFQTTQLNVQPDGYQDASITSDHMAGAEPSLAMYNNFLSLLEIPVPIVGALQGHAIGGGLGLALCCDIRICHSGSLYGSNFVKLGLHPGMATTYFLPRLVGVPRAVELLLTGRLVNGTEAERLGLATGVGDTPESVVAKAMDIAQEIASNAPIAVRWTKRSIYRHLDWHPREAAWDEANLQAATVSTADFKEGVEALLKKRAPNFKGR